MDGREDRRGDDRSVLDTVGLAFASGFAVLVAGVAASKFLWAPFLGWNDTRLAPSAALLNGYELYYRAGEGPLLGHIYGPVAPFVYLPAVLLPSPESAVYLGTALVVLLFFGPVLLILFAQGGVPRRWTLAAFLVFFLYACHERALSGSAFWIHVDAPALGFGALACAGLCARRRGAWVEAGSALALVLSVGSKQVALPLLAALPLFLLLSEGARPAMRYLAKVALALCAVLGGLTLLVDFEAMWFKAITVPMLHPWKWDDALEGLLVSLGELALLFLPIGLALGACLWLGGARVEAGKPRGWRAWLRENPWTLFLLVAVLFVPTSLLGRVKVGGDVNALAYTLYFGALAALLLALRGIGKPGEEGGFRPGNAVKVGLLAAGSLLVVSVSPSLGDLERLYRAIDRNPERTAWRFAQSDPRAIYFPFHPLVNLMAKGRADHATSGLISQDLTGESVEPGHLWSHLPPGMALIGFRGPEDYSQGHFPEFTRQLALPALPGWTVLAR